jgi:hypothetical protein
MIKKLEDRLEPVSWLEMGIYTAVVAVSLLTCYLVGVSIVVTGTPWNADVTNNVLNWIQVVAISVIIIQLEKIRQYCLCVKNDMKKKKK